MKKPVSILITLLLLYSGTILGQSKTEWAEKTAFHSVMATTFHPAEEGNLEPVKKRSAELVAKAKAWKNSTPPAEYNTPAIKKNLKKLLKQSIQLDKMVKKKASDEKIKKAIFALHDQFHTIAEICNHKSGEEH